MVGMGDHVPAFLMRPVRPPKAVEAADIPEAEAQAEPEAQPEDTAA